MAEKRKRFLLWKNAQEKLQREIIARAMRAKKLKLQKEASKLKTFEYLYVWEFSKGKLLLVKELNGGYAADIFIPEKGEWFELQSLSSNELRDLIEFK